MQAQPDSQLGVNQIVSRLKTTQGEGVVAPSIKAAGKGAPASALVLSNASKEGESSSVGLGAALGGNAYKRDKKARAGVVNSGSIAQSSSMASGRGPSHGNSTIESDTVFKFQH